MKKLLLGAAAIAVVGTVPQIASAHDFTLACNNGTLVVTPDFQQFNPTYVIGDGSVTVTWTDGFKKTHPLPPPCPTPPTPTTPEVVPPPPAVVTPPPPAVVTPLPPKKPTPKPPIKRKPPKRVITCGWILSHYSGSAEKRMIVKFGFPNCGKPYNPPVAG